MTKLNKLILQTILIIGNVMMCQTISADDAPKISIGTYTVEQDAGETKFNEPTISVYDANGILVTSKYKFTYSIMGGTDFATPSYSSKDKNGVAIAVDQATGTTVQSLYGDVIIGKAGKVKIVVSATSKTGADPTPAPASYEIDINEYNASVIFMPDYSASADEDNYASQINMDIDVCHTTNDKYYYNSCRIALSDYKITTTNNAGKVIDITSYYTVSKTYTGCSEISLNNMCISINGWGSNKDKDVTAYNTQKSLFDKQDSYITYTFTPNSDYEGIYPAMTKKVLLNPIFKVSEGEIAKKNLSLTLTRDMIPEENVTVNNETGEYTIHVYKFGQGDEAYGINQGGKYSIPTPYLKSGNAFLPTNSGKIVTGQYGDFTLYYQLVYDKAYQDDCEWDRFTKTGTFVNEGDDTGFEQSRLYSDHFDLQNTTKPGLIKVAVYAVMYNNTQTTIKDLYQPVMEEDGVTPKELTDSWGGKMTVYSEPIYFYIDVMKRIPTLTFDPDPNTITFIAGDEIDFKNRFKSVTGLTTDDSNGLTETINWGGGENGFLYELFISDRMSANYIRINNWTRKSTWEANNGDEFSFRDTLSVYYTGSKGQAIQVGDWIKLDDGTVVEITESNIGDYPGRTLTINDFESGITYKSKYGRGDECPWTMTFLKNGKYSIPYTIRPWTHVKFDAGHQNSIDFNIESEDEIHDTKLKLSESYVVVKNTDGSDFDEPEVKVVVPVLNSLDVTSDFDIKYSFDTTGMTAGEEKITDIGWQEGHYIQKSDIRYTNNGKDITFTTQYYVTWDKKTVTLDTKYTDNITGTTINASTGEVVIGNKKGQVTVKVSAQRNNQGILDGYNNPADATYIIKITDQPNAEWEIISTSKTDDRCTENERGDIGENNLNGRMHFLNTDADKSDEIIFGGTLIKGVPGIQMIVGNPSEEDETEWYTKVSTENNLKKCCQHETCSVYADCNNIVTIDEEGIPTGGAFYKFIPSTNGFLTIDARLNKGSDIVLIYKNSSTGTIGRQVVDADALNTIGDYTFTKPLLAGETYYLYDATVGTLRLHGFGYQPAYIMDENTSLEDATDGLTAAIFMNGLTRDTPTLISGSNSNVEFGFNNEDYDFTAEDYASINENGVLTPIKMTMTDDDSHDIFSLEVKATVKSTNKDLGDDVNKTTHFYVMVIDIPTYRIKPEYSSIKGSFDPNLKVSTNNYPTAITMTFGGWADKDYLYNGETKDGWTYKSTTDEGADRIGSEEGDYSTNYNKTIDGFKWFVAPAKDVLDENDKPIMDKGKRYNYATGSEYETEENSRQYNTTYRLPCKGAFLKFEPEESGTLMVYLVQNGCVDYYPGVSGVNNKYQVKWRPLFITDETGKPVEMVNDFALSQYGLSSTDEVNQGSLTLGVSRCDKYVSEVQKVWNYNAEDAYGTSFDWSNFYGTDEEKKLLYKAWPSKLEKESIIRLENGGFALAHKAYVRYTFDVKAGKTYYVFQYTSKPEFGGFAFIPAGYPNGCTYNITSGTPTNEGIENPELNPNTSPNDDILYWHDASDFDEVQDNYVFTLNDGERGSHTERNFTADQWQGICLPFSVSSSKAEKIFGENYTLLAFDKVTNDNNLHFIRHANTYIEAGRPYLIKPTKNVDGISFDNVTIEGSTDHIDPSRFDVDIMDGLYTFMGFYNQTEIPQYSYYVNSKGLRRLNVTGKKIGGYRAMFHANNSESAQAKPLAFQVDDLTDGSTGNDATGILLIDNEQKIVSLPADAAIYNISGQKVGIGAEAINSVKHGIYIINGKKIIK